MPSSKYINKIIHNIIASSGTYNNILGGVGKGYKPKCIQEKCFKI